MVETVPHEEAEMACREYNLSDKNHENCVYDVMATGDVDIAGAYDKNYGWILFQSLGWIFVWMRVDASEV